MRLLFRLLLLGQQTERAECGDMLAPPVSARLDRAVIPDEGRTGTPAAVPVDRVSVAVLPVQQAEMGRQTNDRVAGGVDFQDPVSSTQPATHAVDRFRLAKRTSRS